LHAVFLLVTQLTTLIRSAVLENPKDCYY